MPGAATVSCGILYSGAPCAAVKCIKMQRAFLHLTAAVVQEPGTAESPIGPVRC